MATTTQKPSGGKKPAAKTPPATATTKGAKKPAAKSAKK